jgi:hypothetical protein
MFLRTTEPGLGGKTLKAAQINPQSGFVACGHAQVLQKYITYAVDLTHTPNAYWRFQNHHPV